MSTLLDTNVLTRAIQHSHPQHKESVDAVAALRRQGEELCLVPQNFYEFWVVATRPATQNGLGMTVKETQAELAKLRQFFVLIDDTPAILIEWERLVIHHRVIGKSAHDARLVAAMNVHRLSQILTFNAHDFQNYQGIAVISPQQLVATP